MTNSSRFKVLETQERSFSDLSQVIVDTNTGVYYLSMKIGSGTGITPLLDEHGKE